MAKREPSDVEAERARRWWQTRRPIGTITRAAAFIDDVGFAFLFPNRSVAMPTLWGAASDKPVGESADEWGPEIQRVWGWKDELPLRGLAWYGRFLRGKPSFLSQEMLADLYPRAGRPDDFEHAGLGPDAVRIAHVLLRSGPLPAGVLRQAANLEGKQGSSRFSSALTELGRALVVTNFGTEQVGSGWASAVLELTARAFDIPRRRDLEADRRKAVARYLRTMVWSRPIELALAFGMRPDEARAALNDLASRGMAFPEGAGYRLAERTPNRVPGRK